MGAAARIVDVRFAGVGGAGWVELLWVLRRYQKGNLLLRAFLLIFESLPVLAIFWLVVLLRVLRRYQESKLLLRAFLLTFGSLPMMLRLLRCRLRLPRNVRGRKKRGRGRGG